MKKIKKLMALVIALAMVLGMGTSVFAAGHTISVSSNDTHTYKVFQVLTGTLAEEGSAKLGNPVWGADAKENPGDVVDFIDSLQGKTEAQVADLVAAKVDTTGAGQGTVKSGESLSGLETGYYILVDVTDLTAGGFVNDTKALHVVQVLNDVDGFTAKYETVTPDKKIVADSLGADTPTNTIDGDGTVDNVSIGDTVSFELTGTIPAKAKTDYDYFFFIMNDTLSAGLTFDASTVKVYADNTELTADRDYKLYTGTDSTDLTTYADGKTFQVALLDAKAHAGKTIRVTYNAVLNENAVIGEAGNPNKFDITFSNNPNHDYDGEQNQNQPGKPDKTKNVPVGETPEKETKTYTTGIKIQKVDDKGNILTGAGFTITGDNTKIVLVDEGTFEAADDGEYFKLKDGKFTKEAPVTESFMEPAAAGATKGYVVAESGYQGEDTVTVGGTTYREYKDDDAGKEVFILHEANSNLYDGTTQKYKKTARVTQKNTKENVAASGMVGPDGVVTFSGLGSGTFTISETTTPAGYNTLPNFEVTIGFDKDDDPKWTASSNGTDYTLEDGVFKIEVVNNQGSTLPSTGGIGTTIFYVVGAILVIGAGVVLVTKRRMNQ